MASYQQFLDSRSDEEILEQIECLKGQINNVSTEELLDRGCGGIAENPRKFLYYLRDVMFKRHWGVSKTAATKVLILAGVLYLIFKK